jgi:cyclic pyranopterin phosphate synthase
MPAEGVSFLPHSALLTVCEFERVVRAASALGVTHVKLTGGEPTIRRDLIDIVKRLRAIDGIELSMTTNGLRLATLASDLRSAGLDRITVSVDSLREDRYAEITGGGRLSLLRQGLDVADVVFPGLKLNVVIMRGVNEDEIGDFARLAVERDWTIRFIEFMPLGRSVVADRDPSEAIVEAAEIEAAVVGAIGPLEPLGLPEPGIGPARVFATTAGRGRIGFINAMSRPFCESCNRLRLDATGVLRSCLFDGGEVDLRPLLRSRAMDGDAAWRAAFAGCTAMKPTVHSERGDRAMSTIGG